MAQIVLDDINGANFLGLEEGETLVGTPINIYRFPPAFPVPLAYGDHPNITVDQAVSFLKGNAMSVHLADATITITEALIIAYHRLLAVQAGIVSPNWLPADNHVDYTETQIYPQANWDALIALANFPTDANVAAALTADVKAHIRRTFTDRVAIVAFVFRARGHHWMDTLEDLYQRVWQKTRHPAAELHLSWKHISRTALHAVYPTNLDRFWVDQTANSRVNGALGKRLDVAPAGFAGPHVLAQGLADLLMIAPGIKNRVAEANAYLAAQLLWARGHRFNGSVNARYYGAERGNLEEKRLGAIAATIKAAVDGLTDDAPLGKSPALIRIAANAPITGAVLGRAIGQISNRPEVVNTLMIDQV